MNTRRKGKSDPPEKPLAREEWDFRAQPVKSKKRRDLMRGVPFDFLPDDEVWFCWWYEFTRRSREAETVLADRKRAKLPRNFEALLAHYWKTDPTGRAGIAPLSNWFYQIWPEWPEKPFLSVKAKERERRYELMWSGNPKQELRMVPLRDIYRFVVDGKAGKEPEWSMPGRGRVSVEPETDTWILRRAIGDDPHPPGEVVAFEIDYNLNDTILTRRFQNWLQKRRATMGYAREDLRGKSRTKRDRAELCALGAKRLMDSGMSRKVAQDYTAQVSGLELFADSGDWTKAKKKAKNALNLAN